MVGCRCVVVLPPPPIDKTTICSSVECVSAPPTGISIDTVKGFYLLSVIDLWAVSRA